MMQKTLFTILSFITHCVFSQNLVLNPSFERYNRCPELIGTFSYNVENWSTPNLGTTDFFSNCSKSVGNTNYNGSQKPNDGNSYAGFYLYSPGNYREYIQGEISETLDMGKEYRMVFYISLAENSTDAIKNIGVLFTEEQLGFPKTDSNKNPNLKKIAQKQFNQKNEKFIKPNKYTINQYELIEIQDSAFFNNTQDWTKVSIVYTAKGFEKYFSIGNFQSNGKTKTHEQLYSKSHRFAYYYVDDVSIESMEQLPSREFILEDKPLDTSFESNRIYIFKNVLFDFDKSELLSVSIEELDKLSKYLNRNQETSIEIYGHTDNVGTAKRNKELSLQRAKAVSDYLIAHGLNAERIKWFGYGSSKPMTSNQSEQGRAQNRRVEFKLIPKE
ncbi:MAG: OmpA family protein [Gelidibacter sp.]